MGQLHAQSLRKLEGWQLIPKWWMPYSLKISPTYLKNRIVLDKNDLPGKQWWINKPQAQIGARKAFRYAPEDFYLARGHWGQFIGAIPSENIVIARFGNDRDESKLDVDEFMRRILQVARNVEIPQNNDIGGNPQFVTTYDPGLDYSGLLPQKLAELKLYKSYRAKEFCSCYFVMKKSKDYCMTYTETAGVPSWLAPVDIDDAGKVVSCGGNQVQFVSDGFGCRYEQ